MVYLTSYIFVQFYSICIIYEYGPGPHNTTWRAAVWRPMTYRVQNPIKLMHFWAQKAGNVRINVTLRRVRGKARSITCSECVSVASVTQSAMHTCPIMSPVASLALPNFSTLSHKRYDFQERNIERKMCVLMFSTTFVWNFSHCSKNLASYYHKYSYVLVWSTHYSCQILVNLKFSWQLSINNIKFHKICPLGTKLFYEDRLDEGNSRFRKFANAPKHEARTVDLLLISAREIVLHMLTYASGYEFNLFVINKTISSL
jgi:hypothetical protein